MAHEFTTSHVADSLSVFRGYKKLAEGALAQVDDEQLYVQLNDESNSIAIIMKHMAGNMRSRWIDFLTTDGEKPNRDRDSEFVDASRSRGALMAVWEDGWSHVFAALSPLTEADLERTVTIRGEAHSVTQAINRQIAHYAYHVGQIVFLAKQFQGERWKSLTIPRNRSAEVNRRAAPGQAGQR
jgi:uncharacterized damage-inducible protein DinB